MSVRLDHGEDTLGEVHEINVTPFINVMLVLLIIFMVAAPLATVDIAVNLPASTAEPQPRPERPLYLTVKSDLSLALGENPVSRELLRGTLDAANGDKETRVGSSAARAGLPAPAAGAAGPTRRSERAHPVQSEVKFLPGCDEPRAPPGALVVEGCGTNARSGNVRVSTGYGRSVASNCCLEQL
jgi:biopolymer transport protein ExbD